MVKIATRPVIQDGADAIPAADLAGPEIPPELHSGDTWRPSWIPNRRIRGTELGSRRSLARSKQFEAADGAGGHAAPDLVFDNRGKGSNGQASHSYLSR
jgi:hypothetical protein